MSRSRGQKKDAPSSSLGQPLAKPPRRGRARTAVAPPTLSAEIDPPQRDDRRTDELAAANRKLMEEKEEISHMFAPFFTTRLHQGGTGLGLSITHGIVQDHGGAIEVESSPGRGTSITLVFPIELCKSKGANHG